MAAITATAARMGHNTIRNASAQATTGQVDWVWVPRNARFCSVYLNFTATAGNTPIITPSFLAADPVGQLDTEVINVAEHAGLTGITAVNQYVFDIGPGVTGIANDTTNSASADSYVSLNAILPTLMGFKLVLDRTSGDETYTYTLSARFTA